ncbi:MAG: TIGR01777 family oxidoreductase [Planctomycetales bacterium]|nr:TIGR01777 family oxidoreductase [Planctomycetales bacterium]
MKILVSGASGLVGSALRQVLAGRGAQVLNLTRSPRNSDDIGWDPGAGQLDPGALEGIEAVVHLAGESIANGRWTAEQKQRILNSRVRGTQLLAETVAGMANPPRALISASAIGYYGDRGSQQLTEDSAAGTLFLSRVCQQWEEATSPALRAGIRVVNTRFGVILSREGGALKKMLTPFRLGLGGRIGDGRQYWSWITLQDTVRAIDFALQHDSINGPINVVAPHPVTNSQFTKSLGRVLHRPTIFPMPAFAARLALGEMADELLLASANVIPAQLNAAGFRFLHAELEPALREVISA